MSRQDKATTEKFTRILRELVKLPENKVCADCKRNDPRWASWNIGVFLCIRCSGIHRGMGTHISKVKSVDLDTWTPEQMESIQKWGNHLANLYWEAHLKPGHIPPEHKMESFIRSKYESKRWAMEGPPPLNPSDLENSVKTSALQLQHAPSPPSASQSSHTSTANITTRTPATTRQPQPHPLLSTNFATNLSQRETTVPSTSALVPASALVQPKAPENDLFSLDFHAPTPPAPPVPEALKKDVKQDILSLFSSPQTASVPGASTLGQFGTTSAASPWVTQAAIPQQEQQPITSMLGTSGVGTWGVSSGWGAPAAAPPAHNNLWGASQTGLTSQQQSGLFNTSAVWGSSLSAPTAPAQETFGSFTSSSMATSPGLIQPKKDDVFGDLWGGFK